MAEKRSKRIGIVIELARRAEDEAAREFESARQKLADEQRRQADLDNYYIEYERLFAANTQGVRALQLMQSREFLMALADACEGQRLLVAKAESLMQVSRDAWQLCYQKHKSLQDLAGRYRQQEFQEQDKEEQKQLDEWVNQAR